MSFRIIFMSGNSDFFVSKTNPWRRVCHGHRAKLQEGFYKSKFFMLCTECRISQSKANFESCTRLLAALLPWVRIAEKKRFLQKTISGGIFCRQRSCMVCVTIITKKGCINWWVRGLEDIRLGGGDTSMEEFFGGTGARGALSCLDELHLWRSSIKAHCGVPPQTFALESARVWEVFGE